jgi:predicted RNA-binding protein with PUA-like domain
MKYWLVKSEPEAFSWQQMKKEKNTSWDGVRNYQARNNLKEMKVGDFCFFYHSGKERAVVGIIKVVKESYLDPLDKTKKFVAVGMEFVRSLKNPVTLHEIKQQERLARLPLLKQSRLSVMPIEKSEWDYIIQLSEV